MERRDCHRANVPAPQTVCIKKTAAQTTEKSAMVRVEKKTGKIKYKYVTEQHESEKVGFTHKKR